jgi:hypothetical protein
MKHAPVPGCAYDSGCFAKDGDCRIDLAAAVGELLLQFNGSQLERPHRCARVTRSRMRHLPQHYGFQHKPCKIEYDLWDTVAGRK